MFFFKYTYYMPSFNDLTFKQYQIMPLNKTSDLHSFKFSLKHQVRGSQIFYQVRSTKESMQKGSRVGSF